ncbi:MAG: hypothetical protein D6690_10525 [Nitrospirae bacterium]|nr:MAG: hypothetical protein D6690_10525 [Nitrospirota bacterium]
MSIRANRQRCSQESPHKACSFASMMLREATNTSERCLEDWRSDERTGHIMIRDCFKDIDDEYGKRTDSRSPIFIHLIRL